MKPLMLDQIKRRWFFWALFCLVHFIFGSFNYAFLGSGFIFPAAFILGPNIWLLDLQRGYSRVALTLPYTARQIGRTWWWISVGFPALVLMVFSFLGTTVRFLSEGHGFPFVQWVGYVAANSLLYGSLFWFFSGNLNLPAIDWRKRFQRFVSFGFYLAIIAGCFYLLFNMRNDTVKTTAFFVCTLAMTILGWLRAESMIADYGEYRPASHQPQNARRQFAPPVGHGGILFIVQNSFAQVWFFGFIMFLGMNVIGILQKHSFDWHHLTENINGAFFIFFFYFVLLRSPSTPLIFNIRFLRTVPIPTNRLVAVLLGEAILPLLTFCLAITALAWYETGSTECVSFFKIEFLAAASVSVFITVSIWNTQANFIKAILLVILILATFVPSFYQLTCMDGHGLPFWFVIAFTAVVFAGSHWATCQILSKSSSAYRPRQNQFSTRWGWNLGR